MAAAFLAVWVCLPAAAETVVAPDKVPTPAQKKAVEKVIEQALDTDMPSVEDFLVGTVELNDDGRPDLIIHMQGIEWCGSSGCAAFAILATTQGFSSKPIEFPNFGERVTVRDAVHKGMHDLSFDDSRHVFVWTGKQYD
ncbi:hypothetical protein [Oleomonas cavernae]|nr:hypothetical protein [Oleomonas cavernae]